MRIAVVNNMAPFIRGGAELLASELCARLTARGHEVDGVRIPFSWDPPEIIDEQALLARAISLDSADLVIALKFPAYYVRHGNKVLWLLHQYRQAYDLYGTEHSNLPDNAAGQAVAAMVRRIDNASFSEARRIFCNSEVTRLRLRTFNDFDSEVLYPPLNDPQFFSCMPDEGFIFAGGRVNSMKRQHLLVEAMRFTDKQTRLVIAGPADDRSYAHALEEMVERFSLSDRVKLDIRFLDRQEYADYVNTSMAVAYLPVDEDSLGYVAMEAAAASKPTVTATDSGGILSLVHDRKTGFVADPEPQDLAAVIDRIFHHPEDARALGVGANQLLSDLGIEWDSVLDRLTE